MNDLLFQINLEPLQNMVSEAVTKAVTESLERMGATQHLKPASTLLTRKEASRMLKITLPTLSDWTKRKFISSYTIGGRIYYKSDEIEKSLRRIN